MSTPGEVLLKLALRALERGDVEGAREGLLAVLAIEQAPPIPATDAAASAVRAVRAKSFAAMIEASPNHVHALIARGVVKTIGTGRGLRVLVNESVEAMRVRALPEEGATYVRRRAALRIVGGDTR